MNQTSKNQPSISDQVKLPVGVAFQVVLQGMRIRFGRSMVTIMGVVLGIAFLMSILTSQALKKGVADEQEMRLEIQRMNNFLLAEMGLPSGKELGVIQTGSLNLIEKRFLRSLAGADTLAFNWFAHPPLSGGEEEELNSLTAGRINKVNDPSGLSRSRYVLAMGGGPLPVNMNGMTRVGTTRNIEERMIPDSITITPLARQLRPGEIAMRDAEERLARFRGIWIVMISLLVTVIGITNAMLMSVTERFREIGTMKCLGALSSFIRQIFLFESCLIGATGGIAGSLIGAIFSVLIYAFTYGFGVVATALAASATSLLIYLLLSFAAGVVLSVIAALYPANVASRMVPANALRSNV